MKQQSQFIKLPGERVNQAQVEAGIPLPDTFPAFFWVERSDIAAVMEAVDDKTETLIRSTIFCKSGESFYCSLPAEKVMKIIDKYDQETNCVFAISN